jgi:hypothetical protein
MRGANIKLNQQASVRREDEILSSLQRDRPQ